MGSHKKDPSKITHHKKFADLENLRRTSAIGGGDDRIEAQHKKGKLTARERIDLLIDQDTFRELGRFMTHRSNDFGLEKEKYPGDGVVTGYGKINDRIVYIYSQDFTVFGGSLAEAHAKKITQLIDLALKNGAPVIGLNDSGGARIQEGVLSLGGYADIFYRNTLASGVVPQISAIMGPCAGGAVYSPAITDFVFMVENTSYMFVTGPKVVKTVTHEDVTAEQLGGAETHSTLSGVAHFTYPDDKTCLEGIKKLLSYIPQNCEDLAPQYPFNSPVPDSGALLDNLIPEKPDESYDIKEVIKNIIDPDSFFEVHENFAANMVVGFARLEGRSIGIIANQPMILAGVLDIHASIKGSRFVRFCDSFNVPLWVLVDVPGFMPGTDQEWNGIITSGAKLLYAFSEATVPRVTLITRKAYGGAYDVMNSKHIGADMNFAWPTAEIAVMGPKGAAEIIFKKEIDGAADPEAMLEKKEMEFTKMFANPYLAAASGFIDEVIFPHETRARLIDSYKMLENKVDKLPKKKHGNIPL